MYANIGYDLGGVKKTEHCHREYQNIHRRYIFLQLPEPSQNDFHGTLGQKNILFMILYDLCLLCEE